MAPNEYGAVRTLDIDERFKKEMLKSADPRTILALIRTIEAEKRTYLAELRTGIGIFTIPMSLVTILIATSRYYDIVEVFPMIVLIGTGAVALLVIGGYLTVRSLMRLRNNEMFKVETCSTAAGSFCEEEDGAPGEI